MSTSDVKQIYIDTYTERRIILDAEIIYLLMILEQDIAILFSFCFEVLVKV